jgi:deoxyribonuclease-4
MPLFGAHMSVAGGCHNALLDAQAHGCDTVQIFTKNSNQWQARDLTDAEVQTFRRSLRDTRLRYPSAHASYLINLASPDQTLYRRSVEAMVIELRRAESLGLSYLVVHPGAHMGGGEEAGLARVAKGLDKVHARCPGFRAKVLLETTAGQGTCLGHRFEHLAHILALVKDRSRLGVCLDTCHVFAAGYRLWPEDEYRATFQEFHRRLCLKSLLLIHLNDSLKPFNSRIDRHAHIGRGALGLETFRLLVNDPLLRARPMILETAKEDGDEKDTWTPSTSPPCAAWLHTTNRQDAESAKEEKTEGTP